MVRAAAPEAGHLAAGGSRSRGGAERLEQEIARRHAEHQQERLVAVVRVEPVGRREREAGGDEDGFVAGAARLEEALLLLLQADLGVVERAREVHHAVDARQLGRVEPAASERAFDDVLHSVLRDEV